MKALTFTQINIHYLISISLEKSSGTQEMMHYAFPVSLE